MEMITLIGTVSPKEREAGSHRRKRNVYCKDATENNGSLGLERVPDFLSVSSEYIEMESLQS